MRKIFILFLFILSEVAAQNTNDSAQVRHDYQPTALNTSLRAEFYLKKGSYFFAEGLYKASKSYYYYTNEVFKEYLWVGYEHKASEKWYLGISGRTLQFPKEVSFISRVNVSHRGKISSVGFLKELTLDQISRKSKQNYARVGLAMGLYKKLKLGKATIIPVLSYKAFEIFDLKNANSFLKNRLIDLTRMRLDIYFMVHKNLFLGIYAMRETDYYYTLGYSIPDPSNPSLILYTVPDFKVNSVIPTLGFSLNFILKPDNNSSLIPGLPLR
jgi:hypothetical protein